MALLSVKSLVVAVDGKHVLHGTDLVVGRGETHVLMGANGSGKSSLANVLMGHPNYRVHQGSIQFGGKDLLTMTSDERSRAGLYVAWQSPITIPGVSVFSLCKASYEAHGKVISKLTDFKHTLEVLAERVGLTKAYVGRGVNEGFSGGERKRLELLQLLLLKPKLAILDEIDSGLDAQGVKILIAIIREMQAKGTSFLLITHNKRLLASVAAARVWKITD